MEDVTKLFFFSKKIGRTDLDFSCYVIAVEKFKQYQNTIRRHWSKWRTLQILLLIASKNRICQIYFFCGAFY